MPLILAIEPDKRQASKIATLARGPLQAELVVTESAERAVALLNERVPDLVLTSMLLSPKDEAVLADRLRELDAAGTRVQTLVIPVLATPRRGPMRAEGGLLTRLRKTRGDAAVPDGCDPAVFGAQITEYLERAAAEKRAAAVLEEDAALAGMPMVPFATAPQPSATLPPAPDPAFDPAPQPVPASTPLALFAPAPEPRFEAPPEPVFEARPEPEPAMPQPVFEAAPATVPEPIPEPPDEVLPVAEPAFEPAPVAALVAEAEPEPITETIDEPVAAPYRLIAPIPDRRRVIAPVPEPVVPAEPPPAAAEASGDDDQHLDEPWSDVALEEPPTRFAAVPEAFEHEIEPIEIQVESIDLASFVQELEAAAGGRTAAATPPVPASSTMNEASPSAEHEPAATVAFTSASAWPALEGAPADHGGDEPVEEKVDPALAEFAAALEALTARQTVAHGHAIPGDVDGVEDFETSPDALIADNELWMPLPAAILQAWPRMDVPANDRQSHAMVAPPSLDAPAAVVATAATATALEDTALTPPPAPSPRKASFVNLLSSIRRDIEQLRSDKPAASPFDNVSEKPEPSTEKPKKRKNQEQPVQDEWGFFDPEQAGFAALLSKLEEITEKEGKPKKRRRS